MKSNGIPRIAFVVASLTTPGAAFAEPLPQMPVGIMNDSVSLRIFTTVGVAAAWVADELIASPALCGGLESTYWLAAGQDAAVGFSFGFGSEFHIVGPNMWNGLGFRLGAEVRSEGRVHGYLGVGASLGGLEALAFDEVARDVSAGEVFSLWPLVVVDLVDGGAIQVRAGPSLDVRLPSTRQDRWSAPSVPRLGLSVDLVAYVTGR